MGWKDTKVAGNILMPDSDWNNMATDQRTRLGPVFTGDTYGVVGDGVVDDYAAILAAHVAATVSGGDIVLAAGTYLIGTSITFNADTRLVLLAGAKLKPESGVTITINGGLKADLYQIFDLTPGGAVTFGAGRIKEVYPQWWGAVADDSTECTAAFISAIGAANNVGKVYIPAGTYKCSTPITGWPTISSSNQMTSGILFQGASNGKTIIKYYGTTGYALEIEPANVLSSNVCAYNVIENIHFQCNNIAAVDDGGAISASGHYNIFRGLAFTYCDTATCFNIAGRNVSETVATETTDTNRDFTTTDAGVTEKYAIKFTTDATPAVTFPYFATARLAVTGTGGSAPAGTVHYEIWSDSAGSPNVQVGSDSETILCTAISTAADGEDVTLQFGKENGVFNLSASTAYWLVIVTTGYTYTDGVTEVRLRVDAGDGPANGFATFDATGAGWGTSSDGANYYVRIESGVAYGVTITDSRSYGPVGRVGRAIRVAQAATVTVSDCYFACKTGLYSDKNDGLFINNIIWLCTPGPLYEIYSGDTNIRGSSNEGGTTSSILGNDARVTMAANIQSGGYYNTTPGVTLTTFEGRNDVNYGTYDPTLLPSVWNKRIITARGGKWYGTVTEDDAVVDAAALDGYCLQINAINQNAGFLIDTGDSSYYGQMAPGLYRITVWAKDTTQYASDFKMFTVYKHAGGGYTADQEVQFTLTSEYQPYHIWMRVRKTNFVTERHDHRFYFFKRYANANTISVSHVVVEYDTTDVLGRNEMICYNSDESDADGARESRVMFYGQRATDARLGLMAEIVCQHDSPAAGNDHKGKLLFNVNSGASSLASVPTAARFMSDGGVFFPRLKSGADQGAAGAAAGEVYIDTDDQTLKVGV